MALAGPMEPDPCGYFWICEYTISPNLLDSSHGYGRRAILADFFFFFLGGNPGSYVCKAGSVVTEPHP
jgi:hypothetical protein